MHEAIDVFLDRRALKQDANAIRRWRWDLDRFERLTIKTHLKDIDRTDVEAYWRSSLNEGAAVRTIYNHIQSLLTFLTDTGRPGVLPKEAMPEFDKKAVDYYNETNPTDRRSARTSSCTGGSGLSEHIGISGVEKLMSEGQSWLSLDARPPRWVGTIRVHAVQERNTRSAAVGRK